MNMKQWREELCSGDFKRAMPLLSFPSVKLLGITVRELIGSSELQAQGMKAVAERTKAAAAVSMMDLSVEAEAFGAQIRVSDYEVPTVMDAIVRTEADAVNLQVPSVGAGRTSIYIEAIAKACRQIHDRPVFAGVIGSFSLAGRLIGVTDIMVDCYEEPELVHTTLKKSTDFLIEYMKAYKAAGANGVVIAEPLTGLLSPELAVRFSEPYLKQAIEAVQTDDFIVIYHNCGNNTPQMIDSLLRLNAAVYHFGNAVNMKKMLETIPGTPVVMGNVDPAGQFFSGTPESIREATLELMCECCPAHPNFVISSGCDIPPESPWENIDAFFEAVDEYNLQENIQSSGAGKGINNG